MRDRPGRRLAVGSRSAVHEWGSGAVAKVPFPATPDGWIVDEARITDAVHGVGTPVPRLLGLETYAGRRVGIYERVDGPSMWAVIRRDPHAARRRAADLAAIQADLLSVAAPVGLPRLQDRLVSKVYRAAAAHGDGVFGAAAMVPSAEGRAVCHGDLHPGNVILAGRRTVVIDWFDGARGEPAADIARSLILLSPTLHGRSGLRHLPGGDRPLLDRFRAVYLDAVLRRLALGDDDVEAWMPVVGVARLAEGVEPDGLLRRWQVAVGTGP